MFIWTGINVDSQLPGLRQRIAELEERFRFSNSNLTLPFHISLKMSFPVEDTQAPAVIAALEAYLTSLPAFDIPVKGMEWHETIAWIRMRENEKLNRIHEELNTMLSERFGIGLHEYDLDFLFHTTLFMDSDAEKVRRGYEAIKNIPLPSVLRANRFLIGSSPEGKLGMFRTEKEIG